MKKLLKTLLAFACAATLTVPVFAAACDGDTGLGTGSGTGNGSGGGQQEQIEHVDYVSQLELDFDSNTKKQEVTPRLHVDGDTTHFDVVSNSKIKGCNNSSDFYADDIPTKGYAKARYLAVNTPESTGQIEEWGKAASKFTKEKIYTATSWIIESNDENWNIDSTGERFLLWVWYLPEGETKYRNLNIEILQNGYAWASGIPETRYADIAQKAINQAQAEKLVVFSGEKDPDYHYGGPINVDLKELRFNTEAYEGKKIRVEGLVVANFNQSAYIEDVFYDIEGYEGEGIRIGMPVYYSYIKGKVVDILSTGNYVSVVGVVQWYDNGGYYQITDIKAYDRYKPVANCEVIEEAKGLDDAYTEIDPAQFVSNEENIGVQFIKKDENGDDKIETVYKNFRETILGTSVTVSELFVNEVYTTTNEASSSKGAMTLTCSAPDGTTIRIRTEVLKDAEGNLITSEAYLNKTITVKGIVELFQGDYQIKCHRANYITVWDEATE